MRARTQRTPHIRSWRGAEGRGKGEVKRTRAEACGPCTTVQAHAGSAQGAHVLNRAATVRRSAESKAARAWTGTRHAAARARLLLIFLSWFKYFFFFFVFLLLLPAARAALALVEQVPMLYRAGTCTY